jgi:hypothetical protein
LVYTLKNVLSDFGSVSRGVAAMDADGYLTGMKEHTVIVREGDTIISKNEGNVELPAHTPGVYELLGVSGRRVCPYKTNV